MLISTHFNEVFAFSSAFVILTFVKIWGGGGGGGGGEKGVKRGEVHEWCLCHFCHTVV